MIQANTVITGDSLTVLRDMEADSVDMVITDPPYGMGPVSVPSASYTSQASESPGRLRRLMS